MARSIETISFLLFTNEMEDSLRTDDPETAHACADCKIAISKALSDFRSRTGEKCTDGEVG
jgi:hypothetical protein